MILLDTHIWVRWLAPQAQPLPPSIQALIDSAPAVGVSAISHWEVAYLHKRGKLDLPLALEDWLDEASLGSDIQTLHLNAPIAQRAATLTDIHRDPADRFIIATALIHNCSVVSLDQQFPRYPELHGALFGA